MRNRIATINLRITQIDVFDNGSIAPGYPDIARVISDGRMTVFSVKCWADIDALINEVML